MGVREQSEDLSSPLCRFLNDCLPRRESVVESWARSLRAVPESQPAPASGHSALGWAMELRLDLDLADRPMRWQELSYLPADRYAHLLKAAGFEHTPVGVLPTSDTTDPVLLRWSRAHQPLGTDSAQRAALATCLDLASIRQPMHQWRDSCSVDERRSWFISLVGDHGFGTDSALLDALASCWTAYLAHGRRALAKLGDRVIVAPQLGRGFGVGDLVVGRTLVEVKVVTEPTTDDVDQWLRQLLGYVLLDRHDALSLDTVAVYCPRQKQLLAYPIPELLVNISSGASLQLAALRTSFYHTLHDDLNEYAAWKERERYK